MKKVRLVLLVAGFLALACSQTNATPLPSGSLSISATMPVTNSAYNPRSFDGENYALQISSGAVSRYNAGSSIAEATYAPGNDFRMASPFRGVDSQNYVLLAGGASNNNFTRLDYAALNNPVTTTATGAGAMSFDWVDNDTIIFSSYVTGQRGNLYVADVVANPFTVTTTTTYLAAVTGGSYIRNVRVGDTYGGYAYYGNGSQTSAGYYALELATGAVTQLGTLTVSNPGGSWGLWTVKEVDGYLYLHTTDDGIYVYNMTNATTVGSLYTHYTKSELDTLTGTAGAHYYGFDVVDGGSRMLLGDTANKVIEIVPEPATMAILGLGGLLLRRKK